MRLVLLRRVASPQLAEQLFPLGISVRDHDLPEARLVLADRVHDAVVGDPRDEQASQVGERRLVVERGGEERARLGQETDPRLGDPLVGDVVEDVDHEVHLARIVQERRRAEDRPALLASREDAIAEDAFLRRALRECQPVRQRSTGIGVPSSPMISNRPSSSGPERRSSSSLDSSPHSRAAASLA